MHVSAEVLSISSGSQKYARGTVGRPPLTIAQRISVLGSEGKQDRAVWQTPGTAHAYSSQHDPHSSTKVRPMESPQTGID